MTPTTRATVRDLAAIAAVTLLAVLTSPLWAPMPGALVAMTGHALALDALADYGISMARDAQSSAAAAIAAIDSDGLRTLCGLVAVVVGGDALRERVVDIIATRSGS